MQSPKSRLSWVRRFWPILTPIFIICLFIGVGSISLLTSPENLSSPTPQPTPTPYPDTTNIERLAKPPLSTIPTQSELGSVLYWQICMACHGDRGQGLTSEWQDAYGEDRDCFQSQCHAVDHPPGGFIFPRTVPPVSGGGTLARFETAQELFEYTHEKMPWWNPGSLTIKESWQITAYLLKMNGKLPEGVELTYYNAPGIQVHRLVKPRDNDRLMQVLLAGTIALVAIGMAFQEIIKHKRTSQQATTQGSEPTTKVRRPNFIHHLHPPSIPANQARWRYTLGAGGLAVFLSLILLATGALEMFYYVPTPDQAAFSIQAISYLAPYGGLVRNLHFWSAQALVVVMSIHLLRVVFTNAYSPPRRFNYLIGLGLLVLILLMDFTGYVLRWDEGIQWALVVGTNLLNTIPLIGARLYEFIIGGSEPGQATLVRFYSWHVFGLTILVGILLIWHLFRVRRDGGIATPPSKKRKNNGRISRFELVRREVLAMLLAGAILILLSTFVYAPIAPPLTGTPSLSTEARAPWFFLWVQQLLKIGDPFFWGIVFPIGCLALLALIPYAFPKPDQNELGRWLPRSGRIAQITLAILALLMIVLTILALIPGA